MSNKTRSNARKSRNQHDTATRKQNEARKRQKARKQHMPGQNKLLMLGGLVVLCVALFIPEFLALLGPRIAAIVKWAAVIAIILAILATRVYNEKEKRPMLVTEFISRIVDKILNRDDEDYYDDDDDEWDDDEDWDDFDDEDEDVVEDPKPAVRRRAPATPAPVVEEASEVGFTQEDMELFMQFMEFREAQKKAQAPKPEPAPKTSKK